MPTYEITAPDGKAYEIDGPEGATDEQVRAEVLRQFPNAGQAGEKPVTYRGGFQEPAWLTQAGTAFRGAIPKASPGMAVPPAASVVGRTALQAGGSALDALMRGETNLGALGKEAVRGASINAILEGTLGPVGRFIAKQRGAKAAVAGAEAATKTRGAKIAHDEAMTGALNTVEQMAHKTAASTHGEQAAAAIADDLVRQVPALQGTQASGKGLYDAIYGSGKDKVSAAFDDALKAVVDKGKGQIVQVPEEVAQRYQLAVAGGSGIAGLPANIQALFNKGAQKAGMATPGIPGLIGVDAAELAQKMTGSWKKDPAAYRAGARALDEANIGDPAARAAYKAYVGTSQFIDKAKALTAEGVLDTEKVMKALADLKKLEELRRRGLGSGTEGIIQRASRGGPLAPKPRDIPAPPPEVSAPDVKGSNIPAWYRHMIGAGIGGGVAGWPGMAVGGLLGHAVVPGHIYTRGPLDPTLKRLTEGFLGPIGAAGRAATAPPPQDMEAR